MLDYLEMITIVVWDGKEGKLRLTASKPTVTPMSSSSTESKLASSSGNMKLKDDVGRPVATKILNVKDPILFGPRPVQGCETILFLE